MLKQPHQDEIEEIRAQLQQVLQNHITMMALISNIRNNRTRRMESEQQKQQSEQAQQPEMITPPMKKRAIRNSKEKMSDEADESSKENMPVPSARGVNGQELAELPNNWLASTDDLLKVCAC